MENIPQRHGPRASRGERAHQASVAAAIVVAALAGCSTLERSRDVGNPSVDGATLAVQVCSNCHGIDGNSTSPNFPRLAGQPERYIVVELSEFRSHDRGDPAGFEYMWGLSRKLTDAQIDAIAAYFHRQTPQPNPAGPGRAAAAGKAVLESGVPDAQVPACTTCHGENAEGHEEYPRLAGQHADYLVKQLIVFQRTDMRPAGAVMKVIAHGLQPAQITAVADYLQGLTTK